MTKRVVLAFDSMMRRSADCASLVMASHSSKITSLNSSCADPSPEAGFLNAKEMFLVLANP